MTPDPSAGPGRAAFERREWREALAALRAADARSQLTAADLERFATAALLAGDDDESARQWERAHHAHLEAGDVAGAARCAFWAGFGFMERGEGARAGGWLARARRILDQAGVDCAEAGYLQVPEALEQLESGNPAGARDLFAAIAARGDRFADADLSALGRLGHGQSLIRLGDTAQGATELDEVMISVLSGELSPVVAGIVYCAVIEACQEMFDLRRAQEWTAALSEWCDAQPDLVRFQGQCLVYRAELLRLQGAWADAATETQRAYERLSEPRQQPAVGAVYYCQGELHRLRGALSDADEAFRLAAEWGKRPQPGLALLRLAQGRTGAAVTAIGHALDEAGEAVTRAPLLAAAVEIRLAANDRPGAITAADELATIAAQVSAPLLEATADRAAGLVALAGGDATAAVAALRRALSGWQALDAPYEAARTRVALAAALRALGDEDAARPEDDAARRTFEDLGAAVDSRRLGGAVAAAAPGGLTPREQEVLRLVATGMTNRAIAANLTISEKTVARHLSNIFGKLGVSSRAAATAYAYEHGLA